MWTNLVTLVSWARWVKIGFPQRLTLDRQLSRLDLYKSLLLIKPTRKKKLNALVNGPRIFILLYTPLFFFGASFSFSLKIKNKRRKKDRNQR